MDIANLYHKNEIDYILTDKPQTFTDVSVINNFNTGSDHRQMRSSLTINKKLERARLINRSKKPNALALAAKATEFQLLLENKFEALNSTTDDIDELCENITTTIMESASGIAREAKPPKPDNISRKTKHLLEKRRKMKRDGTPVQHIEYTEICKTIRRCMTEDINNYNDEQQLKALEDNRGLNSTKKETKLGQEQLNCPQGGGRHIH
ncbi:hypothetical protein Pmani_001036 [Petrolisthes manimaculis]|uniref:Uncharacterized protein n=1 Tax=Petrolisthes manimaculis TaxID=1843537 RepID=A0AAE1QKV7_9EUCA|nr:hypothetical protein Pmani_001036 [Petrolisthes manimaculis]